MDVLVKDPCAKVKVPRPVRHEMKFLSAQQVAKKKPQVKSGSSDLSGVPGPHLTTIEPSTRQFGLPA